MTVKKRLYIVGILGVVIILAIVLFLLKFNLNSNECSNGACSRTITGEPITSFFNVSKTTCPENCFLEDGKYSPLINRLTVPIDAGTLDKEEQFLSDVIYENAISYNNWTNYAPMVNKVNELIKNSTSELDKATKILYWLKNSKAFCDEGVPDNCISMTNLNGNLNSSEWYTYNELFDYPYGVCQDSVILGIGMLRTAKIPATYVSIGINHIIITFFADGQWYNTDSNFFTQDHPDFGRSKLVTTDLKEPYHNLFSYFNTEKLNETRASYEFDPQIYSFDYVSKDYAEIFIPNGEVFNIKSDQYRCEFYIANFDTGFYMARPESKTRWTILNSRVIYDSNIPMHSIAIGYNYYKVASNYTYKYECYKYNRGDWPVVSITYIKPLKNHRVILTKDNLVKSDHASITDFNELLSLVFVGDKYTPNWHRSEALIIINS